MNYLTKALGLIIVRCFQVRKKMERHLKIMLRKFVREAQG